MTLKERMTALRSATEYVFDEGGWLVIMVDGRSFSHLIKNKYKKPFDEKFMDLMDMTAEYLCANIQGCKFAYVQSDEITLIVNNTSGDDTFSPFFGNRLTKILSIVAAMASGKFNQLTYADIVRDEHFSLLSPELRTQRIMATQPVQFDCKCFRADNDNDAFAYLLWRQVDCIRNSKQQMAQKWFGHKDLEGLNTDEQVEKTLAEKGQDWNALCDGMKYGRFIYREKETFFNQSMDKTYERNVWKSHGAFPINTDDGKEKLKETGLFEHNSKK